MPMLPLLDAGIGVPIIVPGQMAAPAYTTFERTSGATVWEATTALAEVSNNVLRADHFPGTSIWRGFQLEGASTNQNRNPRMEGAVVGIIGSGGANPFNWNYFGAPTGITREIVAIGVENGIPYVDIRFVGTPSSTASIGYNFEGVTQIPATSGQTWTSSVYVKTVAGSGASISSAFAFNAERSASAFLAESSSPISTTPTSTSLAASRRVVPRTLNNASTLYTANGFTLNVTGGVAMDITLRVGGTQHEQLSGATSLILPPVGTRVASTRAPDNWLLNMLAAIGFNPLEGTIYVEFETMSNQPGAAIYTIGNAGVNSIELRRGVGAPDFLIPLVTVGAINQAGLTTTGTTSGVVYRHAFAWKQDDFGASLDGGAVITDNSGLIPSMSALRIGSGNNYLSGWIRKLTYWPNRIPNAQLPSLNG